MAPPSDGGMRVRFRDLTLLDLPGGERLVIACDAAGGIGPKERDAVSTDGYVLGRFTARVPLMEVVAAGGRPLALVNNCCVEPEPTGQEILRGVLDEVAMAGLDADRVIGAFEKNVPTIQTGLGVTVIGRMESPRQGVSPGDLIVAVGLPKVGAEVSLDDPGIADLWLVRRLSQMAAVHDLLPVGSRGIAAEAADMAATAGLLVEILPAEPGWDLQKSAGPGTTVLAAVPPRALAALAVTLDRPWCLAARVLGN